MSASSQERILYPEDDPTASAEEVRTSLNSSLEEIEAQAQEGLAANEWAQEVDARLREAFIILSAGLKSEVTAREWATFIKYLEEETKKYSVISVMRGETVGNMLARYGAAVWSYMVTYELLSDEAGQKLTHFQRLLEN